MVELSPWTLFFDGSSCKQGSGIGIIIILPRGASFEYDFPLKTMATNNQAEYEAMLKGLQLLQEIKAEVIEIFGDSQLVSNQLLGIYECKDDILKEYFERCRQLLDDCSIVSIKHVPKAQNEEANRLAQSASGYRQIYDIFVSEIIVDDWRKEIIDYLKDPSQKVSRKLRYKSIKYVLLDNELYYRTIDRVLLKCLNQEESKVIVDEVNEGVCGAHQSAYG